MLGTQQLLYKIRDCTLWSTLRSTTILWLVVRLGSSMVLGQKRLMTWFIFTTSLVGKSNIIIRFLYYPICLYALAKQEKKIWRHSILWWVYLRKNVGLRPPNVYIIREKCYLCNVDPTHPASIKLYFISFWDEYQHYFFDTCFTSIINIIFLSQFSSITKNLIQFW